MEREEREEDDEEVKSIAGDMEDEDEMGHEGDKLKDEDMRFVEPGGKVSQFGTFLLRSF